VADIILNPAGFDLLLHDVARVVLDDLAGDVADIARTIAPIRVRHGAPPPWVRHPHFGTPGHLKASVVSWRDDHPDGQAAYVGSLWYGRFLDPRARQLHRIHPFLPTALQDGVDGRTFYF
jgi:hypothetical protein